MSAQCPYCGELVELDVDESGASEETYVEDCSVCCRPWTVRVVRDPESGELSVDLARDDD